MIIARVYIDEVCANTMYCKAIPKGIIGAEIELEYSGGLWDRLAKRVVFTDGLEVHYTEDRGGIASVPVGVLGTVGARLRVGVCGVDKEGDEIIPTLWADLTVIQDAVPTSLSDEDHADPQHPVWMQIKKQMGDLCKLETDAKENLVAAINELARKNGGLDKAAVRQVVEEWLRENPIDIPKALPNPHPLTFTGAVEATYDGSEAVEVVIPQGVSEKELKHIAQIEITEDVREISITEDVDGNPFEITDVYFFMKAIKRDSVSSFKVYTNGGQIFQTNKFGATDRAVWPFMSTVQIGDYRKAEMSVGYNLQYVMPVEPGVYNDGTTIGKAVIKDISLIRMVAANGFKVGDTIDIWGI